MINRRQLAGAGVAGLGAAGLAAPQAASQSASEAPRATAAGQTPSPAASASVNTAAFQAQIDATHGASGALEIGGGRFDVVQVQFPPAASRDFRGLPYQFLGRGTGEPYVNDAYQGGSLLNGVRPGIATVRIRQAGEVMSGGSIEFGRLRISGAQNAGVPALQIDGLLGLNNIHDFSINQTGLGDGVHMGWLGGSVMQNFVLLGPTWARPAADVGRRRTGTGLKWRPDSDIGLGELRHGTARGFSQGWVIGAQPGDPRPTAKLLAHNMTLCEVSHCTDGVLVTNRVEGLVIDQIYVEGCDGDAVVDRGRATLITAPYIVLEFTTGIAFRGAGGVVTGGVLGLRPTGAAGIVVGAESGGANVFGTQLIWGGGGLGGTAVGVRIEAQPDPVVNLFVDYRGSWRGGLPLDDDSYSSRHGGAASTVGSGAVGVLSRRTGGDEPLPCLSRGAVNLKVDSTDLGASDIGRAGVLALSNASVQVLSLSGPAPAITRFTAPNLPDKTGQIVVADGHARFQPSAHLKGFSIPIVFAPGEGGVIAYQNMPGADGACWITGVQRTGPWRYSTAELLRGNGGRPWPAQPVPIVASDGRKAGERPGAGSGCPVWNDGTTWRTVYDNTVVSA